MQKYCKWRDFLDLYWEQFHEVTHPTKRKCIPTYTNMYLQTTGVPCYYVHMSLKQKQQVQKYLQVFSQETSPNPINHRFHKVTVFKLPLQRSSGWVTCTYDITHTVRSMVWWIYDITLSKLTSDSEYISQQKKTMLKVLTANCFKNNLQIIHVSIKVRNKKLGSINITKHCGTFTQPMLPRKSNNIHWNLGSWTPLFMNNSVHKWPPGTN
jgi:hypothetical protein